MATFNNDADYHCGMHPDRTYISKSFPKHDLDLGSRLVRFATKVIDSEFGYSCDVQANEIIIRRTENDRQQIKALFFEDDRSVDKLIFQRFTTTTGKPHKVTFSFSGDEIDTIRWLLEVVRRSELDNPEKLKFADRYLDEMLADDNDLISFLREHRDRLAQLENAGDFSQYVEFCQRRRQLNVFKSLLHDEDYFQQQQTEWDVRGPEAVWQHFFERNPWIFGLNLSPVFLSSLKDRKLEQVVRGYSVGGEGKRVDALMRTNGLLSSLSFIEIKTHSTALLQSQAYRSGAWSVSNEVAGAIAQCHATVQAALNELQTKLELFDQNGNPTGEQSFLYQPRSFLIVGQLGQFNTVYGTNEQRYRSFELYRRNLRAPEIVTFDELYERARALVEFGTPDADAH